MAIASSRLIDQFNGQSQSRDDRMELRHRYVVALFDCSHDSRRHVSCLTEFIACHSALFSGVMDLTRDSRWERPFPHGFRGEILLRPVTNLRSLFTFVVGKWPVNMFKFFGHPLGPYGSGTS